MTVRVLFFAAAKEIVGAADATIDLPTESTIDDLRQRLVQEYPALSNLMAHCSFSVDRKYAPNSTTLYNECEVGCIPPVSGG